MNLAVSYSRWTGYEEQIYLPLLKKISLCIWPGYRFFWGELIFPTFNWLIETYLTVYYPVRTICIDIKQRICPEMEVGGGGKKLVISDQTDGNKRYWWWGEEDRRQRGPRKIFLLAVLGGVGKCCLGPNPTPPTPPFLCGLWTQYSLFLKSFCDVDHFKSLYWICYNIASALCFGIFWPQGMWDPSSLTRVLHWKAKSNPLDYWRSPSV